MASRESGVVDAIRRRIANVWPTSVTWKMHGSIFMEAGIPDILCCVRGRLIFLEVKHRKPGESAEHAYGRTSVEQVRQIDRIRAAGGSACTVLDADEAEEAVREALAGSVLLDRHPRAAQVVLDALHGSDGGDLDGTSSAT
jgi:hypothetical protein|nr:MAG TPA: Nuclease [Caudoviricetes sp.]